MFLSEVKTLFRLVQSLACTRIYFLNKQQESKSLQYICIEAKVNPGINWDVCTETNKMLSSHSPLLECVRVQGCSAAQMRGA